MGLVPLDCGEASYATLKQIDKYLDVGRGKILLLFKGNKQEENGCEGVAQR